MYKILIVEDEQIERNSLEKSIEEISGFDLKIYLAENGQNGFDIWKQSHPDIILADINMPKMSGLEMLDKIRKEDNNVVCFILTSYDYFSYAQKAIQLNVEDFILKPADKITIQSAIIKSIQELQENKNTYYQSNSLVKKINEMHYLIENECFYTIFTNKDEQQINKLFKMANISFSSGFCIVFTNKNKQQKKVRNELEDIGYICIQGSINNNYILFVISNHSFKKEDIDYINNILDSSGEHFSFGTYKEKIKDLHQSYKEAVRQLNDTENIPLKEAIDTQTEIEFFVSEWAKLLSLDPYNQENTIRQYCHELLNFNYLEINDIFHKTLTEIIFIFNQKYNLSFSLNDFEYQTIDINDYHNIEITISMAILSITKLALEQRFQNSSYLLKRAMSYIEKNYCTPINLNSLSRELGVSPNYLSKLFNQEMNRNFTEIINDYRIEEAKNMIKNNYSLKEIAFSVGFGSQSYFTKVFKKRVGLSPKEYRDLQ